VPADPIHAWWCERYDDDVFFSHGSFRGGPKVSRSVVHVITGLGTGGAERMLVQLATAAQTRGFPQHVVSLSGGGSFADELRGKHIQVTTLGVTSFVSAPAGLLKLIGIIRRLSPGVVQGWMYHGNLFAALAHRMAPGAKSRALFWSLRASNMDAKRYSRIMRLSAWLSRWPDIVIANSESGAAFHRAQGFRPRRMVIIDNGIDSVSFRPDQAERSAVRTELGIALDAPVVIHIARVDPMKDHQTFLKAMARVPSVTALLVGSGTDRLAAPPNVKALGLRQDMTRLYAAADIVVSSSAFGEGFSNAIAEGMSAGLVPIATDVGDARRIIGDTGHIVRPADADAIAEAIKQECISTKERIEKGARARMRIVRNFTAAHSLEAFSSLYQDIPERLRQAN
jgi:glycosyltransferase involved in cell wall biosynthesis